MATIKDIAAASGVSVATVSRVINGAERVSEDTKLKVQQAIKALAYHPSAAAKSLGKRRSRLVGLVIPSLSDPLFMSVADIVEKKARENNFQVLINPGANDERRAIELMLERQCEALIVHSSELPAEELVSFARECERFVLINRYVPEISAKCVWLDNRVAGNSMANYMLKHGHQRMALIMGDKDSHETQERMQGIQEGLVARGLVLSEADIRFVEPSLENGHAAMKSLLQEEGAHYSAVMTQTDELAVGALSAVREAGLCVPRDISVLGFGDTYVATASFPRLTTMRYPVVEIADLATQLIFDDGVKEANNTQAVTHRFHAIVTRRESVGYTLI